MKIQVNNYGKKMIQKHKKMEVMGQYIGLKRVKNWRMVVLKVKNGVKIVDTTENGEIIKNMVLLFKFTEITTDMKEVGC